MSSISSIFKSPLFLIKKQIRLILNLGYTSPYPPSTGPYATRSLSAPR